MTTLPALALLTLLAQTRAPAFDGRTHQTQVAVPRLAAVDVDGTLAEPVWCSPTAIHFGIRAHAAPGSIRATLAQRDRIESDDAIGRMGLRHVAPGYRR